MRVVTVVAGAILLGAVAACGGVNERSLSTAAPAGAPVDRLEALIEMDQRIARVGQRLSDSNVDLCPVVRQSAGWALHAASQYSEELRPLAVQQFGLDGDLPGVLAAPPGSAAAAAALEQGDLIVAVNNAPLDAGPTRARPAFEGLETNIRRLDLALSQGPAALRVRRGGHERDVIVEPRRSCGYEFQLNPAAELNARADGRRIFISTALTAFAGNDDELSIILGHEMAHNVLRHRDWHPSGGSGREINTAADAQPAGGHRERQADRVGLFLAARAGFDTRAAAPFWRRFGESNWRVRYPQLRHDSAGARAQALESVQDEIDALRRQGSPLIY